MRSSSRRALSSLRSFSTSSSSHSPTYAPPLQPGVLPAYDQALLYLAQDRADKLDRLQELNKANGVHKSVLEKLEIEAWVNDPETRWRAARDAGALFFFSRRGSGSAGD
jgi:large subunit ribosomal protein L35